jgi:hypothetical protein
MKISRVQFANIASKGAKNEIPVQNPITGDKDLQSVGATALRAYNNIPFKGKFIPKAEFTDWLTSTGFTRKEAFDDLFKILCDETSQLSEKTFDFVKNFKQKGMNILQSSGVVKAVKEDGKINYKALDLIDKLAEPQRGFSLRINYSEILNKFKDENGKINNDVIDIFNKDIPTFKRYVEVRPDVIFRAMKDEKGNFSKDAIEYFSKHLDNKEKIQDIVSDLYSARNVDGTIDLDNIQLIHNIDKDFDGISNNRILKTIVYNSPKEQRGNIVNVAKNIKDDKNFEHIMDNMLKFKLEFNEKNIDFARNLDEVTHGKKDLLNILTSKIHLTPEVLTKENKEIISNACRMFKPEELEVMLDSATYKAGDKKGQVSLENLERYKDIFVSNNYNLDSIKILSSRLSLEEDDTTLKTLHKLYKKEWENGSNIPDKIDRGRIDHMVDFCTLSINDIPKRPMPKAIIDRFEYLLSSKYANQSSEVFENLLRITSTDCVEKLERVNLEELGLKPEQVSAIFKNVDEDKILKFKDFMHDYMAKHNIKTVDLAVNPNIAGRLEITSAVDDAKNTLLYDFGNFKPITNIKTKEDYRTITKIQHDYDNNTETKLVFQKKDIGYYRDFQVLKNQTVTHFDEKGNVIFNEIMENSPVKGAFNIKNVYPDGREEQIAKAVIDPKSGNEIVEKAMKSLDDTKTLYRYEKSPNGNVTLDYKILDKDGKTKMSQHLTHTNISENHYKTTKNDVSYDIKIENDSFIVTNENTNETITLDINELTKDSDENLIPLLKQLSGDELFRIREIGLKQIRHGKYHSGACFSRDDKKIVMGTDFIDFSIFLHEFGHAKDNFLFKNGKLSKNSELLEIYNKEREAFRKNFSESQLDLIGYFASDKHYTATFFEPGNPLIEGVAETNSLLNTHPHNDIQSLRAQYWQQYFPNTISYISQKI